jgi:N-acetylglutamate synthase-like GNAT family acetyltransferase
MIRKATLDDVEAIKKLVEEFYEESLKEYKLSFRDIEETIKNTVANHIGLVAEKEEKIIGCIGGITIPSMFDKDELIGQESIWYITKSERKGTVGIRLLKAFEEECKKKGCSFVIMVYMGNSYPEQLKRFYSMNNYKLLEMQHIKEV